MQENLSYHIPSKAIQRPFALHSSKGFSLKTDPAHHKNKETAQAHARPQLYRATVRARHFLIYQTHPSLRCKQGKLPQLMHIISWRDRPLACNIQLLTLPLESMSRNYFQNVVVYPERTTTWKNDNPHSCISRF